jgi:Fe-S oxidoreductase
VGGVLLEHQPTFGRNQVRDGGAGAEILVTALPLCVLTLEDAVKTTGHEERVSVMDVNELLAIAVR